MNMSTSMSSSGSLFRAVAAGWLLASEQWVACHLLGRAAMGLTTFGSTDVLQVEEPAQYDAMLDIAGPHGAWTKRPFCRLLGSFTLRLVCSKAGKYPPGRDTGLCLHPRLTPTLCRLAPSAWCRRLQGQGVKFAPPCALSKRQVQKRSCSRCQPSGKCGCDPFFLDAHPVCRRRVAIWRRYINLGPTSTLSIGLASIG